MHRHFGWAGQSEARDAEGDRFWTVFMAAKRNRGEVPPELELAVAAEHRYGQKSVVHSFVRRDREVHPEERAVGHRDHQG